MKNLRGDIFGGLTAGVVALPLCLAFGVQSGLGAIAGLYGAIVLGFFAALFGGTNTQISGPTGPMTVISAMLIASLIVQFTTLENALPYIIFTFVLAGIIQILFGIFRVGAFVKYIPYPVISGFMTGIGIIIILMQVFPTFGSASPKSIIDVFLTISEPLSHVNISALALTGGTILIIYLFPKITKLIPSQLVALIVMSMVSTALHLSVPIIGDIATSFPKIHIEALLSLDINDITIVIGSAVTLAALGSIDSLLTSIVADNITKTKHKSNKELIGQGIGNCLSGLIGGLPGAGATMRTVVNISAGGKTRLSGIIHSFVLLMILVAAASLAAKIPLSVLGGILISVGISIIDYKGLKHILHVPKTESVIMLTVLFLTVFVNLLQAVAVGMVLAAFFFMHKMGNMAEQKTLVSPLDDFMKDMPSNISKDKIKLLKKIVYIKNIDGPLFFGFVSQFQDIVAKIPNIKYIIIRMKYVPYIDQSGLYALEDAIFYLKQKNIKVFMTCLQAQPRDMLEKIRLIPELIPNEDVFIDLDASINWILGKESK